MSRIEPMSRRAPGAAPGAWDLRAACAGRGDLMDPAPDLREIYEPVAVALCQGCPVLADCRAWVLQLLPVDDPGGVCAAMTEAQRERARWAAPRPGIPGDRKQCGRCREIKRRSEFHRSGCSSDGLHGTCKRCKEEMSQVSRRRRRDSAK